MNLNGPVLPCRTTNVLNRIVEIKRTRRILQSLIGVVLTFSIVNFFLVIYSLSQGYRTSTYEPIPVLLWVLFFASGLLVTEQLCLYGLFVFAWLGIVNIIWTCSMIVLIAVGVVIVTSQGPRYSLSLPYTVIPIVAYLTCVIFDATIVIFAFKLAYLIKKNRQRRFSEGLLSLRSAHGPNSIESNTTGGLVSN